MPNFENNANVLDPTFEVKDISIVDRDTTTGFGTDAFMDGRSRCNFAGMEVINTTPALYRGGAVTVYNQMGTAEQQFYRDVANRPGPVHVQSAPPPTAKKAMLLQGARQWGAEKGVYMVGEFSTGDLPAIQPAPGNFLLLGGDWAPGKNGISSPGPGTPINLGWTIDNGSIDATFVRVIPLMGKGCYFTGLHENTTLQLNARFGVEMFPTEKDEIAMLASSMSPIYDPEAIAAYQKVLFVMPPGVQLDENFTGDWFKNIMGAVGKAAPTILRGLSTVIPHPGLKLGAAGLASIIEGLNGSGKKKEEANRKLEGVTPEERKAIRAAAKRAELRKIPQKGVRKR
jgi:hypothetical protein